MENRGTMKLLLDTNIFLEIILDQEKSPDAKTLLSRGDENEFFISDYSLHSIGLLLFRLKQYDVFRQFLMDMMINVGMIMISLAVEDMETTVDPARMFNFDFGRCLSIYACREIRPHTDKF
jgi:PIN domain nuclease of toxin-antitoxin system